MSRANLLAVIALVVGFLVGGCLVVSTWILHPRCRQYITIGFVLCAFSFVLFFVLRPRIDDTQREPLLQLVRSNFSKLNKQYAQIPLYSGSSAYTDNKTVITLCLSDPETGVPYDENTIMYVALHELAHVVSTNIGHGKEFRKNFATLLARAHKLGFYDPTKPIATTYCGITD